MRRIIALGACGRHTHTHTPPLCRLTGGRRRRRDSLARHLCARDLIPYTPHTAAAVSGGANHAYTQRPSAGGRVWAMAFAFSPLPSNRLVHIKCVCLATQATPGVRRPPVNLCTKSNDMCARNGHTHDMSTRSCAVSYIIHALFSRPLSCALVR